MDRARLPLHALRAFEAAARHLNLTRAALELCVSQGAVSQQVALLEQSLGVPLFRRLPRGLALTDEGLALMPIVGESFDRIGAVLDRYADGRLREVLTVGVVGTFAIGWLASHLSRFAEANPQVDLRMMTNNNRVDLAAEGLDMAIRFGDGVWHALDAEPIMAAPLSPMCTPSMAERLREPAALSGAVLLRSYRADEWPRWFAKAGVAVPSLRGPVFDSSLPMVEAAKAGLGVALAPAAMFKEDLATERLVLPFSTEIDLGAYWLTKLSSRRASSAMSAFSQWIRHEIAVSGQAVAGASGSNAAT